ncbi:MAG: PIG-L deacetylase family protein [Chloroflexota bacterium]
MTEETPHKIERVLGIFAHPDDAEFFCGATLARWAAEGADVHLLLATSGDKGSADPEMTSERLIEIREEEARKAAEVLGAKGVLFLRHPDGELAPSIELRRQLVRQIRLQKPDTVVTSDPTAFWYGTGYINHPDHRAIGDATLAAVFPTARDRLNFIEHERDEGLEPHKVARLYIAIPADQTVTVDVTDHIDRKLEALKEHKSQFEATEENLERIKKRSLDPTAPEDMPRYVEHFRVMSLA